MSDRLRGKKTLNVSGFLEEFEKDDLKRGVDIVELFSSFGVELEKKGKNHVGLCPFHEDRNPSLSVDREKGLFNCFGCGAGGDVIEAVKLLKHTDFKGAASYLKGLNGKLTVSAPIGPARPEGNARSKGDRGAPQADLPAVADYYHKRLLSSKEAKDYPVSRGLTDMGLCERFRLGFGDGSLASVLSEKQKKELTKAGLFTESGKEFFLNCLIFPLFDEAEKAAGFYGRKIGKGKPAHLYLPGPHKGLFNGKAFAVYPDEIILTESVIDALSLLQLGIQNVVPCYGVNGLTDIHLKAMKDNRTKTAVIAFDGDEAGRKGSEKLKEKLLSEGIGVKDVFPPQGKDWNEFLTLGGKRDVVEGLIENAAVSPAEKTITESPKVKKKGERYEFAVGDRSYRVIGVKRGFVSSLRVNVRFEHEGKKQIDNVDLYSARSRTGFAQSLSVLTGIPAVRIEHDLIEVLEYLEEERDKEFFTDGPTTYEPTEEEKALGLSFLTDPDLFDLIVDDLGTLGYVGERVNKILTYLAASSRKTDDPISVIVLSQSAAGKSYLIDTVKKCIPPEDVVSMTSLSDQALNYLPEDGLLHKFLVMGEAVHGEIIEHQVREALSAHELSRLVTMKDPKTGELSARTVRKKVVVSLAMSSTNYEINQENASRSFLINIDESTEQTRAIHEAQRKKYSLERYRDKGSQVPEIIRKHQAAQRLLTNRIITNPFAERLRFPDRQMRSRRDHERFIDLIACVCFLRQFQKDEELSPDGLRYIKCDLKDYSVAYEIMTSILPSTLTSFPRSAIGLYETFLAEIRKIAQKEQLPPEEVKITQKELRERTGLSHDVVKWNLRKLAEYEYVKVSGSPVRGSRRSYGLAANETLDLIDISVIPTPEEMEKELQSGGKRGNELEIF